MDAEKIAIKIQKEIAPIKDRELAMLKMLELAKEVADVKAVMEIYSSIKNKETLVAEVISRAALEEKEKALVEKRVQEEFKGIKIIFDYLQDANIEELMLIKVEDRILALDIN